MGSRSGRPGAPCHASESLPGHKGPTRRVPRLSVQVRKPRRRTLRAGNLADCSCVADFWWFHCFRDTPSNCDFTRYCALMRAAMRNHTSRDLLGDALALWGPNCWRYNQRPSPASGRSMQGGVFWGGWGRARVAFKPKNILFY